jgi:two-component system OmpR family response regulator
MDTRTRVLLIDDEDAARRAVAAGLREAGCDVLEAADGVTGLEQAVRGGVDLVVLDLRLPGLSGEQLLERLRLTSAVPVIVTSAKREEDDRVAVLDHGADDYLVKPFTVRELLARIRAVLRRSEPQEAVVTIGGVTIDFAGRTATCGGARAPLTAQEFAVLECLARHRGRVVTRAMLEAAIHPGESPPAPDLVTNIVDVLVLRLRKKLGHDLITTRRGQGFVIDG